MAEKVKAITDKPVYNEYRNKVKFGEFVCFWTKVYHYVPINVEDKTRWSLNFRYKNLFSPYSQKGYLDFFEPINYSELTNLVLSSEK